MSAHVAHSLAVTAARATKLDISGGQLVEKWTKLLFHYIDASGATLIESYIANLMHALEEWS